MAAPKATELIAPEGEIERAMFPGDDQAQLESRVQTWITEGLTKAAPISIEDDKNEAAKSWVYYRAYMSVYRRLNASPTSTAITAGSKSYNQSQIDNFRVMANDALGTFKALVGVVTSVVAKGPIVQPTVAVRTVVTY